MSTTLPDRCSSYNTCTGSAAASSLCSQVFGPESSQEKLYNCAIATIVDEVLEGFNCTIFAYGQTGTGKTYTMEGGERSSSDGTLSEVAGVIPRAISQIFQTVGKSIIPLLDAFPCHSPGYGG